MCGGTPTEESFSYIHSVHTYELGSETSKSGFSFHLSGCEKRSTSDAGGKHWGISIHNEWSAATNFICHKMLIVLQWGCIDDNDGVCYQIILSFFIFLSAAACFHYHLRIL